MRIRITSAARFTALAAAATLLGGCAISNSVESLSDSVSSPFEWSSSSSGNDDSAMYREDVERLTAAYVRAGADAESLGRGIAALAGQQGITDWSSDAPTVMGVGAGLRAAGLDAADRRAFLAALLGPEGDSLLRLAEHPTP